MTFTRLQTVDATLVDELRVASVNAQRRAACRVAEIAVEYIGMSEPLVDQALDELREDVRSPQLRERLCEMVERLDERAWDLRDQVDEGTASKDGYLAAFATARAAAAVHAAYDDSPVTAVLEATYEAQAAAGDVAPVAAAARQALDSA